MYYVTHPDGAVTKHTRWEEVELALFNYNVENAQHNAALLCPAAIAEAVKRDGGSPWQDNEFEERTAQGEYTGRYLVIEGQEGPESLAAGFAERLGQ